MGRKPDDQYAVLGLGEQLAQHDTGVARRAGDVGPARRQLVNGSIGARLQLRGESVERQCCVLRSQPRASGEDNSAAVSPTAGTAYRTMNAGAAPVRRPSRNACAKFGIGLAFTERKPRPRQRWSARRGRGRAIAALLTAGFGNQRTAVAGGALQVHRVVLSTWVALGTNRIVRA